MPKLKTHKGAAKRFKISGNGKILRSKAFKSHLLSGKARKRKRSLKKKAVVDKTSAQAIRRLLPYGV